ncbi:MAG TPA: radical SAM protein [Vicinamibacterales bacterium]|jgi:MoaA/NifB/PqqE/SkfB family radical SAM enzyme|nr:radical SAM protein [Vicinamibacterales bacterium]
MDLTVITTYRCDSQCSMCHIWQNPTLPHEEIALATLEKIPSGIDNLNITGGEPTLRRDLPDIVDILYPKARTLEISSNGLHAERLEPIIRKYPDIKVRFSLEAPNATSDAIRGEKDGFERKVAGLRRLKALGGRDLGFAAVIQDDNAEEIVELYRFARREGVELATSALHNAFQFHKSDNIPYDRVRVAKRIEGIIVEMLRTWSVKNWFRAYLNLGLIAKTLGHDRLIRCTAGTDFVFVDPWSDVYACNVRPDLRMGNLAQSSWAEVFNGDATEKVRAHVCACDQNCWMVTTARTAMRSAMMPALPKLQPLLWVIANRLRVAVGGSIPFDQYIDYTDVRYDPTVPRRVQFLNVTVKRRPHAASAAPYASFGTYFNR